MLNRCVILAFTTLLACGTIAVPARPALARSSIRLPGEQDAVLEVRNDGWMDVNIYLRRGSSNVRLGMVTSGNVKRFTVPAYALGGGIDLRIHIDPIGSLDGYVTDALLVRPGQLIVLRIENDLKHTSYGVW